MKRNKAQTKQTVVREKKNDYYVAQRLDESIPLQTEEWTKVEQMLMRLTEFAPPSMVTELVSTIASFADDQARRGYILGQEDLMKHLTEKAA
jgi:CRISPR/Cas system-associated protein Csm6